MFESKFKEEVRRFMAMSLAGDRAIEQHKEIIADLRKQNKELMNRLMATDFKELQTFSLPEETSLGGPEAVMDFTEDEELAGEVVDVEGRKDE